MGQHAHDTSGSRQPTVVFGPFRLLPLEQELRHGDELVPLRPKAFAILRHLVNRPGELVTREELLARFWGDVHLSDGVLKTQIREIRQALGDGAREPRFIETRHRLGYRFIGEIAAAPVEDLAAPGKPRAPAGAGLDEPRALQHFVGRSAELDLLTQHYGATLAGERRVVFVTGEAGAGKSALVNAFLTALTSAPDAPTAIWGQCIDQYGAGEPYLPIIEALRRWCARPEGEDLAEHLKQNAPAWLPVLPNLRSPEVRDAGAPAVPGRMLREMAEALESFARTSSLVLLIEDLEWADHSTLDLLAYLAQRSGPARLMVIGTYRPRDALAGRLSDVSDTLKARRHCVEVCVPRLGETDVSAYLSRRFAGHRLPAFVHGLLHRRTAGNALFMVGVIEGWLDRGLLATGEAGCELRASEDELARLVPHNIVRMIEKELDRLEPFERGVLEAASVAGTEFSTASVAAALGVNLLQVEETCMRWARRGQFLRGKGQAEWNDGTVAERYEFLYVLYQQVTYDQLGAVRQAHFHARVGERLEAGHALGAAGIAPELALHFERGRDYGRAVRYLAAAGERALQRSAYREAIDHVTLALELSQRLPDDSERTRTELDLQLMLAVALRITKGYAAPEVDAAYTRAAELCERTFACPQRTLVLAGRGAIELLRGKSTNALALGAELLRAAENGGNTTALAAGHLLTGIAHCRLGRLRAAEAHLEAVFAFPRAETHSLCETLVAQELGSIARAYLGYSLCLRGHFERAKAAVALSFEEAEAVGNPFAQAHALCFRSVVHRICGDWDGAFKMAEALATLSSERGFAMFSACAIHVQGAVFRLREEWELGLDMLSRGIASFQATGSAAYVSQYVGLLAECYANLGASELALELLDEGLAHVDSDVERLWNAELYRIKGDVLWHAAPVAERHAEAERCWLRALDIARAEEAKLFELRAAMSLARYWHDRQKPDEGRVLLAEIYARFAGGTKTPDLEEAAALLAAIGEASSAA